MRNKKREPQNNNSDLKSNMYYRSLAPISEMENAQEYLSALSWAINKGDIHNIAVSGPYGSGKSSIIKTFLNKNQKRKILHISLASFKYSKKETLNQSDNNHINELEEEILKQIFYSVSSKKIPRSRYRRISEVKWINTLVPAIASMIILLLVLAVFKYDQLSDFIQRINKLPNSWPVIVSSIICILLFLIFCVITKWFKENAKIGEVKLPEGVDVKFINDSNSVFNKNMDEIVYFFEKTKTEIVIIEDLDRYDSPLIFSSLRNLNTLLNSNEKIKGRIKFIYAIRDDLFKDSKERTKFFDFIIPVVPVVSSTNSNEVLRESLMFNKTKDKSGLCDISGQFITMISPYINDMRDIICVCNEFFVFKNTLKGNQSLDLSDEKMFSLIVFKNLYPKDFSELEDELDDGIVKQAFLNKQALVNEKESLVEKKRTVEKIKLNELNKESLKTIKELKSALLMSLTNPPEAIYQIIIDGTSYTLSKILDDSFDVDLLKSKKITINTFSGTRQISDLENTDLLGGNYFERIEHISKGLNECVKQSQQRIAEYKQEIDSIHSWSMKKAISILGTDFLADAVTNNQLLVFLLRNGYIDETYGSYINYFRPNSISHEEMNYILGIRNHISKIDYSFPITNTTQVFDRLMDFEFKQPEMLNYSMVDYTLSQKPESTAAAYLMDQLSNQSDISLNFIKSYIERRTYTDVFIRMLVKHNNHLCETIFKDDTISIDKKYDYLVLILLHADINDILSQDDTVGSKPLTEFILSNSSSLNRLNEVPVEKLLSLIEGLNIVFFNNDFEMLSDDIKEYVFSNNKYVMNVFMLTQLFAWKRPDLLDLFNTQNYAAIVSLAYDPLLKRIESEFEYYVSGVYLSIESNTEENSDNMNIIIDALLPENYDLCIRVLDMNNAVWHEIKRCCNDNKKEYGETRYNVWQYLFSNDRVKPSIENVISYFDNFAFDDVMEKYFERHESVLLANINDTIVSDEFKNSVLYSHISESVFKDYILEADFDFEISDFEDIGREKTKILIEEDILAFSLQDWIKIHALWPELSVKYAINNSNDFMLSLNEIVIDEKTLIALFDADVFKDDEKVRILSQFDIKELTKDGAVMLSKVSFLIPKAYSDEAWKRLDLKNRIQLMTNQLTNYSSKQLSSMIGELGSDYSSLVAGKRHRYSVTYSEENDRLLSELYDNGYLTSKKINEDDAEEHSKTITGFVREIAN